MLDSPADIISGSSRVPVSVVGTRDVPLITSAEKARLVQESCQ